MNKNDLGYCEWGMVTGACYDGHPPFKIWKAKHEVSLLKEDGSSDGVIYVCSDCLNYYYIEDEEKQEGEHYVLSNIDKKALDKWNKEEKDRDHKRAEYLNRIGIT